ncbi:MAG: penicillin-binding protein 2 [Candidatus Margulisiibacteriota bacterium]|nr:penicillin-binding protein 2 [Candidatus Margulisiibacteriota bacterium]
MLNKNQVLFGAIMAIFALLFLRLVHLQITERGKYIKLAIENAAKTVAEPAPRGVIYDRFGRVMVESRPIFSVRVLPYVLNAKSKNEREKILNELGKILGEKIDTKVTAAEPIIVKDNISLTTAIRIEERKRELAGVVVTSRPVRLYKYNNLASHILGHVGEIEAEELVKSRRKGYRLGDVIGKDGVEKIYDKYVRGKDGGKKIEVDVYGSPTRVLESLEPVPGGDMKLTLDLKLQQAVEKALGGREGAVVVMDVKSGEILALASYPNYDPNVFTDPLINWKWKELGKKNHPFMNRPLAHYPPGSIFKVITLAAALEEGKTTTTEVFDCKGYYRVNNRIAKCWLEGGHGPVDTLEGLVWSCDIVFYELGKRLGPDLIAKYAKKFGLGERTKIDLPQEKRGNVPDRRWKKKYLKENWYDGDSINYGIGQGFVQVTPLQMASVYAGIATGRRVKPYVVDEIMNKAGQIVYKGKTEVIGGLPISEKNLEYMRAMLRQVVNRATGVAARIPGFPAAGKTGTAENPGKAHAWFICYAPYDDPEIVISVFVAHGEHGDKASAYVARDILKWYKQYRFRKVYSPEPYEGQYILHGKRRVPYGVASE